MASNYKIFFYPFLATILLLQIGTFGTAYSQMNTPIPEWFKDNVKWWTDEKITDTDFLTGLAYLIKTKIISVDNIEFEPNGTIVIDNDINLPKWVKNDAKWWAKGLNSDLKSGIQLIMKEKIDRKSTRLNSSHT